ncbi:MAG: J domain-containing protein [Chloroflexi bacterium]|nr:J domain-containing protein [Chloroflexota bacterium]
MNQRLLPYTPQRDVYRLLGVPSSATTDEISAACRRLSRTFHPDRNQSGRATEEMQVVNVVRQVMSDPEWRAIYDRERYRFHAAMARPSEVMLHAWPPIELRRTRRSPVARYLRAAFIGLRAVAVTLAPPRCRGCRTVVTNGDVFCAACGTPLLPGG